MHIIVDISDLNDKSLRWFVRNTFLCIKVSVLYFPVLCIKATLVGIIWANTECLRQVQILYAISSIYNNWLPMHTAKDAFFIRIIITTVLLRASWLQECFCWQSSKDTDKLNAEYAHLHRLPFVHEWHFKHQDCFHSCLTSGTKVISR